MTKYQAEIERHLGEARELYEKIPSLEDNPVGSDVRIKMDWARFHCDMARAYSLASIAESLGKSEKLRAEDRNR